MNNSPEMNSEIKFEDELFNSFKFYGYLFPENVSEVEAFEHLHSKNSVNTPFIEDILSANSNLPFATDLEIGLAAYSSPDDDLLDLPEEDSDDPEKQ